MENTTNSSNNLERIQFIAKLASQLVYQTPFVLKGIEEGFIKVHETFGCLEHKEPEKMDWFFAPFLSGSNIDRYDTGRFDENGIPFVEKELNVWLAVDPRDPQGFYRLLDRIFDYCFDFDGEYQ